MSVLNKLKEETVDTWLFFRKVLITLSTYSTIVNLGKYKAARNPNIREKDKFFVTITQNVIIEQFSLLKNIFSLFRHK